MLKDGLLVILASKKEIQYGSALKVSMMEITFLMSLGFRRSLDSKVEEL